MNERIGIYQKMFEEIEDYAILLLDKNGNIENWNKGAERIKGYKQEEIIGKNFSIFYTVEDLSKGLPELLLSKAKSADKAMDEGWRVRQDGTTFWGSILITAIYDDQRELIGFSKITRDLTGRKKAEEQLKKFNEELEAKVRERTQELMNSEARYRHLFSNSPLSMWVLDLDDFRFLDVNEVATFHYGYSKEEFLSMTAYDIRPEEEKQLFADVAHPDSINIEDYNRGTWKHLRKDGTVIDVEIFGHNIVFEGRPARLIQANDITARRIAERKLASRVQRFRAILENNYDAILLQDEEGKITYQSPAVDRMLGYGIDEMRGRSTVDLVSTDDAADFAEKMRLVMNSPGKVVWTHDRKRHKDGHYIWTEGTATNLLYDENVEAIVINFRDITERKLAEEKLMASEHKFRALIENSADMLMLYDRDAQLTYCSPSVEKSSGLPFSVLQGSKMSDNIHEDDADKVRELIDLVFQFPEIPIPIILRKQYTGETFIWLEGTITNLLDDPNVNAIVCNYRNISERKEAEQLLENSYREIEKLLHHTNEAFTILDRDLKIVSFNRNARNHSVKYYSRGIEKGISILDVTHPSRIEITKKMYASVLKGATEEIDTEYEVDGVTAYFANIISPVKDINGNIDGIFITNRNITHKVVAQRQREFDHSNLSALINNTNDLMWSVDRDRKLITSNIAFDKQLERYSGKSVLKGADILDDGFGEYQLSRWTEYYNRAFSGETFTEVVHTEGVNERWAEISFYPIYNGLEIIGTACYSRNITERKRAEDQLRYSEETRKLIINSAIDAILSMDKDGVITSWNPQAEKTFGWKEQEVLGRKIVDTVIPKENRHLHEKGMKEYFSSSKGVGLGKLTENIALNKEGKIFPIEITVVPIEQDGEISYCAFIKDITERKLADEQLRASEHKFRAMIESSADSIALLDREGNVIYQSPTGTKISGYTYEEVVEANGFSFVHPDDIETTRAAYEEALKQPRIPQYFTYRVKHKTKGWIYADGVITNLLDDQYVKAIISTSRDVTERMLVQHQLMASEHKFKAMIESSTDSISLLSREGEIVYQSPTGARISGFTHEELKGINGFSMLHPEDVGRAKEVFTQSLLNPGVPHNVTYRIKHKTKGWVYSDTVLTNLLDDDDVKAVIVNGRDITERKAAEQKIINVNRLYSFISQINQTIVHSADAASVFGEACRIAIEFGKFKMAWVGVIDRNKRTIDLVEEHGLPDGDRVRFKDAVYIEGGPMDSVVTTGNYYVCNNIQDEDTIPNWIQYANERGVRSCIMLPVKKRGVVYGALSLYAAEINLFDDEEVRLLQEVAGDISFALDVFEKDKQRREAEEKLVQNEFRLNEAQEIAHLGNWEIDYVTGVNSWSAEACKILGYTQKDAPPTFGTYLTAIHPDDKDYVMQIINEAEAEHQNSFYYHRIVRKDGVVRYVYSESKYEFDHSGTAIRLHGIIHDITDSKIAEDSLAQSEANLRLIMDLIPQSIFAKDANGKYIFVNKSFANLYGFTPSQLISNSVIDSEKGVDTNDPFDVLDQSVIATGETETIPELHFTDHKGVKHVFYTIMVPYTLADNSVKAVLGIALDITERKQAESERAKMVADIVQRNKGLEQFSYIISHNLRAPVANIIGISELIKGGELDSTEEKEMMIELSNSVRKLDDVIRDLNYILQTKNQISEKKEVVEFEALLSDITTSIDNQIQAYKVEIRCDFSAVKKMLTLKSYLYSIFYNLISNSIKYSQPGLLPLIEISSWASDTKIGLVFKDNGLGINLQKKGDMVFGLYKRFHKHVEGKGIGLYMVKTQVETLGGKISVESEVNKGTEFRIEFEIS